MDRALATALVESTGVAHASRWVGDTPDGLLRRYAKPTEEAAAQATLWVINHGIGTATELQPRG